MRIHLRITTAVAAVAGRRPGERGSGVDVDLVDARSCPVPISSTVPVEASMPSMETPTDQRTARVRAPRRGHPSSRRAASRRRLRAAPMRAFSASSTGRTELFKSRTTACHSIMMARTRMPETPTVRVPTASAASGGSLSIDGTELRPRRRAHRRKTMAAASFFVGGICYPSGQCCDLYGNCYGGLYNCDARGHCCDAHGNCYDGQASCDDRGHCCDWSGHCHDGGYSCDGYAHCCDQDKNCFNRGTSGYKCDGNGHCCDSRSNCYDRNRNDQGTGGRDPPSRRVVAIAGSRRRSQSDGANRGHNPTRTDGWSQSHGSYRRPQSRAPLAFD